MNISGASELTRLPPKTIRYYEEIGLIRPKRSSNQYRDYSDRDIHTLRFLQRSRSLGFSINDCRQLLALYTNKKRASADVKALVSAKISGIQTKLQELQEMKLTLEHLASNCRGDDRPDCPILDDFSGRD